VTTKGATPLIAAVITSQIPEGFPPSHEDVVKLLLDRGADIKIKGTDYLFTPLIVAIQWSHNDTSIIKLLLERGADANGGKEINGATPLFAASHYGHKEVVRLLLDKGVNINIKSEIDGGTALYEAVLQGHTEIVKLLLDKGADVNAKVMIKGVEYTALKVAKKQGQTIIAEMLEKAGAKE